METIRERINRTLSYKSRSCCSVPQCNYRASRDVRLHQFPIMSKDLCEIWAEQCKIRKIITKFMRVCSRHFLPSDYKNAEHKKYNKLRDGVIPSKNLPTNYPIQIYKFNDNKNLLSTKYLSHGNGINNSRIIGLKIETVNDVSTHINKNGIEQTIKCSSINNIKQESSLSYTISPPPPLSLLPTPPSPQLMCSIASCTTDLTNNIKLFRFPNDKKYLQKWLKIIKELNIQEIHLTSNSRICSDHFETRFMSKNNDELVANALPSIFQKITYPNIEMVCGGFDTSNDDINEVITKTEINQTEVINNIDVFTDDSNLFDQNEQQRLSSSQPPKPPKPPIIVKKFGCIYPNCTHDITSDCEMISVPGDPNIQNIWRELLNHPASIIYRPIDRVCGCHFLDGKYRDQGPVLPKKISITPNPIVLRRRSSSPVVIGKISKILSEPCSIRNCRSKINKSTKFFAIPMITRHMPVAYQRIQEKCREAWLLKTAYHLKEKKCNPDVMLICSKHFNLGKPADVLNYCHIDWVPTLRLDINDDTDNNGDNCDDDGNEFNEWKSYQPIMGEWIFGTCEKNLQFPDFVSKSTPFKHGSTNKSNQNNTTINITNNTKIINTINTTQINGSKSTITKVTTTNPPSVESSDCDDKVLLDDVKSEHSNNNCGMEIESFVGSANSDDQDVDHDNDESKHVFVKDYSDNDDNNFDQIISNDKLDNSKRKRFKFNTQIPFRPRRRHRPTYKKQQLQQQKQQQQQPNQTSSQTIRPPLPIKCKICLKQFETLISYHQHFTNALWCFMKLANYKCLVCDESISNHAQFVTHFEKHCQIRSYFCNECRKHSVCTTLSQLEHMRHHFPNVQYYCCDLCDRTFGKSIELKKHVDEIHLCHIKNISMKWEPTPILSSLKNNSINEVATVTTVSSPPPSSITITPSTTVTPIQNPISTTPTVPNNPEPINDIKPNIDNDKNFEPSIEMCKPKDLNDLIIEDWYDNEMNLLWPQQEPDQQQLETAIETEIIQDDEFIANANPTFFIQLNSVGEINFMPNIKEDQLQQQKQTTEQPTVFASNNFNVDDCDNIVDGNRIEDLIMVNTLNFNQPTSSNLNIQQNPTVEFNSPQKQQQQIQQQQQHTISPTQILRKPISMSPSNTKKLVSWTNTINQPVPPPPPPPPLSPSLSSIPPQLPQLLLPPPQTTQPPPTPQLPPTPPPPLTTQTISMSVPVMPLLSSSPTLAPVQVTIPAPIPTIPAPVPTIMRKTPPGVLPITVIVPPQIHLCSACSQIFDNLYDLQAHKMEKHRAKYRCKLCSAVVNDLVNHKKLHNMCSICSQMFNTPNDLNYHMLNAH